MKKYFIAIFISVSILFLSGCSYENFPAVKKSVTGICHKKGTNFYKNTKNFTSYNSLDDCLNGGGRLPKR
jgi:PBP1b-binding outer membrane lipoprotein LpoB